MTLKKKLFLNSLTTVAGIVIIGAAAFFGLYTVKGRIEALTENSTPFQIKTIEFTKALQEQSAQLFLISSSSSPGDLETAEKEATAALGRIKAIQRELEFLRGDREGSDVMIVKAIEKAGAEVVRSAKTRLTAAQQAGEALSRSDMALQEAAKRLGSLDRSMKDLREKTLSNLSLSSERVRSFTERFGDAQKMRDVLQEVQAILPEVQKASTAHAVNISKGRLVYAIQMLDQTGESEKTAKADLHELAKSMIGPGGLMEKRLAQMSNPSGSGASEAFERSFKGCREKADHIGLALSEVLDGTSVAFYSENSAFRTRLAESDVVAKVVAANTDLAAIGLAVEKLVIQLAAEKDPASIDAIRAKLADKFKSASRLASIGTGLLTSLNRKEDLALFKSALSSLGDVDRLVNAPGGVADRLRAAAASGRQSVVTTTELSNTVAALTQKGNSRISDAREEQAAVVRTVNLVVKTVLFLVVSLSLLVLATGFIMGRATTRSVVSRIAVLTGFAEAFGNGRFSDRVRISGNDEFVKVGECFNEASERISGIATDVQRVSGELSFASTGLTTAARNVSGGARSQEEIVHRSRETLKSMYSTTAEIAQRTSVTAAHAHTMKTLAGESKLSMNETTVTLQGFAATVEQFGARMDSLSERSQTLHHVVGLIDDISDQTNLLALNAAIEAARAGNAGRSFATVADNIRALAQKASTSAKEVSTGFSAILEDVDASRAFMEDQRKAIAGILGQVGGTVSAVDRSLEAIEGTFAMVQEIATAAEEQSQVSEEMTRAFGEVTEVSSRLKEAVLEIEKQAGTLLNMASALDTKLAWFQTSSIS